uniref:Peptidase S1 domain-containing protein n=1 Tax=Cuerna arida TaxID=1464854 RepID=A0A1B6H1G6_9HEMI
MDKNFPILLITLSSILISCSCQLNQDDRLVQNINKIRRLPGLDVCGLSSSSFETKIINGRPAELGAYPWMALVGYKLKQSQETQVPRWLCAGSLITDLYILTAAHCLDPKVITTRRQLVPTTVRLGELDLDPNVADGARPINVDIERVIFHEQYNNNLKINDIGLIRLKTKVPYSDLIRPICLPPPEFQNNLFVGFSPVVAGWGKSLESDPRTSTRLLEVEVQIKELDECRRNITSTQLLKNAVIDNRVLCAGSPGKDSCQGDSGGPLMFYRRMRYVPKNASGNMFQMGIVSYGFGCARPNYPGVYTRVTEYMPWIIDNLDI